MQNHWKPCGRKWRPNSSSRNFHIQCFVASGNYRNVVIIVPCSLLQLSNHPETHGPEVRELCVAALSLNSDSSHRVVPLVSWPTRGVGFHKAASVSRSEGLSSNCSLALWINLRLNVGVSPLLGWLYFWLVFAEFVKTGGFLNCYIFKTPIGSLHHRL